jgi:hypothetical protein
MMQKHEVLQNRTLAFLNRNIKGHGVITGFDGSHCDRTDLRLKHRVKHRLQELRVLRACLADITVEGKMVDTKLTAAKSNDVWKEIETDYDVSKEQFRKKINFCGYTLCISKLPRSETILMDTLKRARIRVLLNLQYID